MKTDGHGKVSLDAADASRTDADAARAMWVYQSGAIDAPLTQATENAGTRYPVFTSDR